MLTPIRPLYTPRRAIAAALVLAAIALTVGCASAPVQRARQVSVNVHAALSAVDDAERAFTQSPLAAQWNTEPYTRDPECQPPSTAACRPRHQVFSSHMVTALKAGRALNDGVRLVPITPDTKADLATVSATLEHLTALVAGLLPPGSTVVIALTASKDVVLKLLPLFLE